MGKTHEVRSHVGTNNRGCDQKRVLGVPVAGISDEVRETGLVGPKAFAGCVMTHQRTSAMPNAHIAEAFERLQGLASAFWSEGRRKVVPDLGLRIRAVAPKAEVQDSACLDRTKFSEIAYGCATSTWDHRVHLVSISLPARVMRSV